MNYYIQGSPARADQIKAAFEKLGFICTLPDCVFDNEKLIFFTSSGVVYSFYAYQQIYDIIKTHPDYKELELPVEPKFKDGDEVVFGTLHETIAVVLINEQRYLCESCREILFEEQERWHLAPKPYYDISNFKPKQWVLVRQGEGCAWRLDIFSTLKEGAVCQFECIGNSMVQCIPFEGNEHLLGTTDMPDEMYINW